MKQENKSLRTSLAKWLKVLSRCFPGSKSKLIPFFLLAGIALGLQAGSPLLGRYIFDVALPKGDQFEMLALGLAWLAILSLAALVRYFSVLIMLRIDISVLKNLRVAVLKAFFLVFYFNVDVGQKHGERLSRLLVDPDKAISTAGVNCFLMGIVSLFSFIGITALALYLDWVMALLCIVGATLTVLSQKRLPRKMVNLNIEVASVRARFADFIDNILAAWRTVVRYNRIDAEISRADTEAQKLAHIQESEQRQKFTGQLQTTLLSGMIPILLVWLAAYRISAGLMSLGTLIAFFSYLSMINEGLRSTFMRAVTIVSGVGQAGALIGILETADPYEQSLIDHPPEGIPWSSVAFENLLLKAGKFELAADRIEFTRGKTYLVTGDSGTGKTTFLEFLAGMKRAENVNITADGETLDDTDFTATARSFGYITNEETLLDRTVAENAHYGLSPELASRAADYLTALGMGEELSRSIKGLSAGETQRVSFVRELSKAPPFFIIDEGLDSLQDDAKTRMLDFIRRLVPHCTLVVCTHNWRACLPVDEIIKVSNGHITQKSHARA